MYIRKKLTKNKSFLQIIEWGFDVLLVLSATHTVLRHHKAVNSVSKHMQEQTESYYIEGFSEEKQCYINNHGIVSV